MQGNQPNDCSRAVLRHVFLPAQGSPLISLASTPPRAWWPRVGAANGGPRRVTSPSLACRAHVWPSWIYEHHILWVKAMHTLSRTVYMSLFYCRAARLWKKKIIIAIILVTIESMIIQTIIFEFEYMMYLFSMRLPKNNLNNFKKKLFKSKIMCRYLSSCYY